MTWHAFQVMETSHIPVFLPSTSSSQSISCWLWWEHVLPTLLCTRTAVTATLWGLFLCYCCNPFNPVDPNPGSKPGRQGHNRRNHVWRGQQEPHPPHRQTHLHPDSTSGKEGPRSFPVTFALLCLSLTLPATPLTISDTWMLLSYQYSSGVIFSQVWSFLAVHSFSMWSLSAAAHSHSPVLYQQ